jgi:hypothetical protein
MVKAANKEIRPETSKAIKIATPNAQTGGNHHHKDYGKSVASDGYGSSPASSSFHGVGVGVGGGIFGSSPTTAAPGFGRRATRKARIAAERSQLSESLETAHYHAIFPGE